VNTVHRDCLRLGTLVVALLAALLIAAPAQAVAPRDGSGFAIADDDWEWNNPGYLPSLEEGFANLAPRAFRFQMIWNAADFSWHMDRARGLIARARAQGVEQIVVTFKKSVEPDLDPEGLRPSAANYRAHVDEIVRQLAGDVDVWGPANEPNRGETWLPGLPGARLLAEYYASLEQVVEARDPTAEITSPDFVDRTDLGTIGVYVNEYERVGGGWGDHVAFHPYWGAHAETTQTTLDVVNLAPPGANVWITEVGAFARDQGNIEATETTQNDKVWWLAERLAALPQVERIHYYHMRGNPNASWDTGLLNVDGTSRIAWHTWCAMARGLAHPVCQPVTPRSTPLPPLPPSPSPPPPPPPPPPAAAAATPTIPAPPPAAPRPTQSLDAAPPAPDRIAPTVAVGRLAGRLTYAAFADGIALRLRPSERSSLDVSLVAEIRRGNDGRKRRVVLARKSLAAADGTQLVRLQPRRKLLGGKRTFVVRVRIRATDPAGNQRAVSKRLRVVESADRS
jgi:Glycosyl hydrolase catalytic core